ncbi:MAG TPA: membrane protein, partial [Mycobacterium sp.]|nr:membrane protein [Mycobacterium sp.]
DTYGKITVLTIPGQVNGPKLAFNAISTDTAVSQDLGVIGRDGQNRIRWGNLLTLPVSQGGLLYVAPVYASPGTSDAASSYPRLIRVAMLYNDRVGYGPTVSAALDAIFGAGAGATAAAPAPAAGAPAPKPAEGAPVPAAVAGVPAPPVGAVPPGGGTLSPALAAAMAEIESALSGVREAQKSGNFAQYGAALQRLDEAMGKFDAAK